MKRSFLILLIAALCIFIYLKRKPVTESKPPAVTRKTAAPSQDRSEIKKMATSPASAIIGQAPAPTLVAPAAPHKVIVQNQKTPMTDKTKKVLILPYQLDEGLVVVQGDVVLGLPPTDTVPETGLVEVPGIKLWPGPTIPFFIQPDLKNPERVAQALALFESTPIHFVPLTNQQDAIVFVDSTGVCKSYVGRVGGKQPIWLPSNCEPREIAHEIMHALGFVHEQNRSDRDGFIEVNFDNIDEAQKGNFEKLPTDFMKASGAGPFDFESLMIYPVWMFSKNGQSTMQSKVKDQPIAPASSLSKTDIERIYHVYGSTNQ
jgi:hypothetical protein